MTTARDAMIPADFSTGDVAARPWDIVVLGAGPAGATLAHLTARRGARVLLIDKSDFPRTKVCGGCLNRAAVDVLVACGLSSAISSIGAPPLTAIQLGVGRIAAMLKLPDGIIVSRSALDASLIQAARRTGAAFIPQTLARVAGLVGDYREVALADPHSSVMIRARMVVVADGLGGQALREQTAFDWIVAPDSRIGGGVVLDGGGAAYARSVIHMAVHECGYVGVARAESDQLIIGTAMDAAAIRAAGSMGAMAAEILKLAGFPQIDGLDRTAWRGTTTLSRRRPIAAQERLLVIGDAAGYVEPFTGQGMAWALQSALDASSLALDGAAAWRPEVAAKWNRRHERRCGTDRALCRWISRGLRQPIVTNLAVRALASMPGLAAPIIGRINRPAAQVQLSPRERS